MNSLEIVVAVLAAMLGGMGLCALGVFCYFMLKGMKELQQAADKVVGAVAIVGRLEALLDRNFGEGSPTARAAKAVTALSENLPAILGGLKSFSTTMDIFLKAAFEEKKLEESIRTPIPGMSPAAAAIADDSAFIPYSEEAAAQYEQTRAAQAQRVVLSKEEMAGMRTDEEPPEPKSQPLPEEVS